MAKTKAQLLEEVKAKGLELTEKNTVKEIESALREAESTTDQSDDHKEQFAKAGKRSSKATREKAEQESKDAKKDEESAEAEKKGPTPKTRPLIERHGKKYREAAKNIDRTKEYQLSEAVKLAKNSATTKFDSTVELHINLNVDPRQADQNIRGTINLPHGTGKNVRVAVFGEDDDVKAAKASSADIAGNEDLLEKIKKEELDFDILIATPKVMAKLGQYAKILGPKGLMPNPKSGTVTDDIAGAVKAAKAGKVEFRVDKQGIVHGAIGKASFEQKALEENALAFIKAIQDSRPQSIKGIYVRSLVITTSMGPAVKVTLAS